MKQSSADLPITLVSALSRASRSIGDLLLSAQQLSASTVVDRLGISATARKRYVGDR